MPTTSLRTLPASATCGEPGTLGGDAQSFADALSGLIRVIQFRDRDRACCHDLSVSQCYALKAVIDAGGATVNDLAAELYLDKSTASRVASGLVEKGLVERRRHESDGRIVRIVVTEAGRTIHDRITAELVLEYRELLGDFDDDVRVAMTDLLHRLAESFASRVEASGGSCCVVKPKESV